MPLLKDIMPKSINYPKVLLIIITSSMKKTFMTNQLILRCLLDYEYVKNHYRLIAVDINRQKE